MGKTETDQKEKMPVPNSISIGLDSKWWIAWHQIEKYKLNIEKPHETYTQIQSEK